jgi:hypothetical protein
MASWIVHLRIAEKLLGRSEGLDGVQFGIGSIAPDSGIPDEKWEKFDPPAEILHFQSTTSKRRQCSDLDFYRNYLEEMDWPGEDAARFSFSLGYFFHLIVDNLWEKQIGIPTEHLFENKYFGKFKDKGEFFREAKRDWYGLDFIYLRDHPESFFWQTFLKGDIQSMSLEFLPQEALKQRVDYIKNFYQREDEAVQVLMTRPWVYLSKERMDGFVEEAVQTVYQIYDLLWLRGVDAGHHKTALELVSTMK